MPKTPVDYSKTIIYKIQHQDKPELLYVGSTTNFTKRKNYHKNNYNKETGKHYNLKVYQLIRENGGWECFNMIEIKKYPCNDGNESRAEEDRIMLEMKASMNSNRAFLTEEETKQRKKECVKIYAHKHKQQKKEYDKKYRQDNKDKLKEKRAEIVICECGCEITKINLLRHKKSENHLKLMDCITNS